ncbi:MAG TPA: DUF1385 domain-containing protein [Clostridia bacterium]|jgi:uncharacterized protein YqhQ|nr:DUF1385 domain-containing protein [Clostridiaceae bacterium]HOF26343.1 DUF1385 domain-containing protein [Clostridia bacterium]HOM34251.1 DUF1385 domain-containing protein [Clostridia bacterium]HOR89958.1 DUF1385 domain-containing protein [Clostridia bacterium]HOT70839.1 DUF1385 domain-containing protein [Clostridia bacterium]
MRKTSIGGSALLEGIMMIGPHKKAIAVRKPDGDIVLDVENLPKKWKIAKIPVLRGAYSLIYQMVLSIKALSYAASFYDIEEEDIDKTDEQNEKDKEQPDEKKAETKSSDGELSKTAIFFAVLLSVAITVGLFILLPNFVIGLLKIESAVVNNLLEGVLRIAIFIGYLAAVTLMKDIKRVWMYHGAEHKTINCYEADEELTVENVMKYPTSNRRCGTSFMFLVMAVSIIVFSLVGWHSAILNMVFRILLLPLVAGLAYELVKVAGRYDNVLSKIVSAPGMLFQKLTAKEPDESMVECAIMAFNAVVPEDPEEAKW